MRKSNKEAEKENSLSEINKKLLAIESNQSKMLNTITATEYSMRVLINSTIEVYFPSNYE